MDEARKRGRPVGAVAQKTREVLLQLKVFPDEQEAYQAAANKLGLTRSAWMRMQLNKAVGGNE